MNKKNNWQRTVKHVGGLIILLLLLTLLPSQSVYAATITVNSTADIIAADGQCTLREAINNANSDSDTTGGDCVAGTGDDTIILPAGTYTLSITGINEELNATGDLDITDSDGLTITGADARTTIIEAGDSAANGIDRVFHIGGGATTTIEQVIIQHGNSGLGAGIWNQGDLTLNDSTVTDNTSSGDGGGIRNQDTLTLNRSTISHNTGRDGAGVWNQNATLELNNSTISTNISNRNGGAIYINNNTVTINNSTIANNSASSGNGGGFFINGGIVNIKGTIIADNTATTDHDCTGTLTSDDYNLIGNITAGCTIGGTTTNNITGSDPELKVLADYGGSTDTHELEGTSPATDGGETGSCTAIDGSSVSTDQRGGVRPQDSVCDIGSYEVDALAVDLASFTATNQDSHLRVEWATVWESNNLGFNLYRNTSAEFSEAERLNPTLISAAAPGSGSGFAYEYADHDVLLGITYHYWLGDIDLGGNETLHGPVSISYDTIPTSVRMGSIESHKPSNLSWLVMLTVLGMTIGVISMQWRK
jgi:CSLREA domain-containing protein